MFLQEQEDKSKQLEQLKRNRITKLASIFSRTNSVLTGRRITVNVVDEPTQHSPAWSSTNEQWLNLSEIKDNLTAESLLSLQGLNFHELGHLRYTLRNGSEFVTWIKDNNLWSAYNCLEDSRIETLMVGYLPSITNWLIATVTDYLLSDDEAITTAFPLVTGRRYLPTKLQQLAVDNYKRPQDIEAIYSIVDEYRTLLFAGEPKEVSQATERAKILIKNFNDLIELLPPIPNQGGEGGEGGEGGQTIIVRIKNPNGHDSRPTQGVESSSVRPVSRQQQEQDMGKSKNKDKAKPVLIVDVELPKQDTTGDTSEDTSKEDTNTSSTSNSAVKNPQATTPTNDKSDDFSDDLFDDSDFNDENFTPHESTKSKTYGSDEGTTGTNRQVSDVLEGVMSDVLKELSKELNQLGKQLGIDVGLEGGNTATPKRANYKSVNANPELVLTSKSFGRELERLRAKFDPAWETEVDTGRLNVNRYLNNEDFDTCFDEWQEGREDVTAIEAVILLDKSGSMAGKNADNAYQSMWAIKKALEAVEAKTTVVTFDYATTLLYSADESAGNTIRDGGADGGTNPTEAILYAKRVLAETDKPIRILFMITDGAWDTEEGENAVMEMRKAGVLTCQAYLDESDNAGSYIERYRHSFELLTQIKSAKDIVILGKELVRLAISRNLVHN